VGEEVFRVPPHPPQERDSRPKVGSLLLLEPIRELCDVAAQLGILRAEPPVGLLQPLIGDLRRVRRRLLDRARHRRAVLARVVSVSSPRRVGKFYRSRRGRQEETSRPLSLFIFLVGPFLAYTQVRGGTPPPTTYCAA